MGTNTRTMMDRRRFVQIGSATAASVALLGATGCAPEPSLSDTGKAEAAYTPGTFTSVQMGKKSDITVEVTFGDTAIESIEITDHGETDRIAQPAFERLPEQIVEYQSLALDAVTGATLSSMAVLAAVEDCVKQSGGDVSALKKQSGSVLKDDVVEQECDLVVIGAGISGMATALTAAQQGAKVVVFEKSSSMGGNALVSGGCLEYTDAPAELRSETNDGFASLFQEILAFNREAGIDGDSIDEVQKQWDQYYAEGNTKLFSSPEFLALQLCMLEGNTYDFQHAIAKDLQKGVSWLNEMNYPWCPLISLPGYSWPHFAKHDTDPNGEGYFNVFEQEMAGLSLDILYATPAEELIIEGGRVVGAKGTCADGTAYSVRAKDAVVIASGGYADNLDMLIERDKMWNWKEQKNFHCDNNYGHTGDGIRMAVEAGAEFGELPFNHMIFPFVDTVLFATETAVGLSNESVYVNLDGVRFCNEAASRTEMTIALMNQREGKAFQVVDEDSSGNNGNKTFTGMDIEYAIEMGILYRADTLEELADLMGVDQQTFVKTVNDYNEMARTFNDPEFGRSSWGENAVIETPPFYASPRTWASHITMDGITTDENHRALTPSGEPVPGLFVVGEAACGVIGVRSLGGGCSVALQLYGDKATTA